MEAQWLGIFGNFPPEIPELTSHNPNNGGSIRTVSDVKNIMWKTAYSKCRMAQLEQVRDHSKWYPIHWSILHKLPCIRYIM